MNAHLVDALQFPTVQVFLPTLQRRYYFRGRIPEYSAKPTGEVDCTFSNLPALIDAVRDNNLITIVFVDRYAMSPMQVRHYALVSQVGNFYPLPQEASVMQGVYEYLSRQLQDTPWRCASISCMSVRQLTSGLVDRNIKMLEFPSSMWDKEPRKKASQKRNPPVGRIAPTPRNHV